MPLTFQKKNIHTTKQRYENLERSLLVTAAICVVIVGSYEIFTHLYLPANSIFNLINSFDNLKKYGAVREPGKGIWLLNAWIGTSMMAVMMLYSIRKRFSVFSSCGNIKLWLSLHMSLGILGPLFITLHTTFKFGGIIATAYWCMMVTMLFGILGRYIYVQIPRTLSGTEMKVSEIEHIIANIDIRLGRYLNGVNITSLGNGINLQDEGSSELSIIKALFVMVRMDIANLCRIHNLNRILKRDHSLDWKARREVISLLRQKALLIRRNNFLYISHRMLHFWHVVHIPLACVMFFIIGLHILVYYLFRHSC